MERDLNPQEIERLLTGAGTSGDPLSSFVDQLRTAGSVLPGADLESRHLAAVADVLAEAASRGALRPRRRGLRRLAAPTFVKVGLAAFTIFAGSSALAATGHLPVVQDSVADAVHPVVNLPGGSDEHHPKGPPAGVQPEGADEANEHAPIASPGDGSDEHGREHEGRGPSADAADHGQQERGEHSQAPAPGDQRDDHGGPGRSGEDHGKGHGPGGQNGDDGHGSGTNRGDQ
jgi:hypothetical protein